MFILMNPVPGCGKYRNNNRTEPTPTTKRVVNYGSMNDYYLIKGINYSNTNWLVIEDTYNITSMKWKIAHRNSFEAEVVAIEKPHWYLFPLDTISGWNNYVEDNNVEDNNNDIHINATANTGTVEIESTNGVVVIM